MKKLNKTISMMLATMFFITIFASTVSIGQDEQEINDISKKVRKNLFDLSESNSVSIEGNIRCPTRPFIGGHLEQFFVSIKNQGNQYVNVTIVFYLWEYKDQEWEFFAQSHCFVSSNSMNTTNPDDVSLIWSGRIWEIMEPEKIRAELYVDDVLVDTQENRFLLGFFIL